MKVNKEEKEDRYGTYPCVRVSGRDAIPQNIHKWLYDNMGPGYKFCIIFDCMTDEWSEPDKETPVYFLDEVEDEVLQYIGVERVRRWLKERNAI